MICEIDGKKIPVISTVQATHEWALEYGRAEKYKRWCIVELITIVFLSMALMFKEELWK